MFSSQTQFRHLKMQVQRKLAGSLRLAEQYFKRDFPMPTVHYDLRGVKAGVAYLQKNEIKFNRTLLIENTHEFIHQVVPHELAHLIVYQVFGRVKPHGKEWQAVMNRVFHLPADTCHQFDVKNVQGKTFEYRCACQTHLLSLRRHHRVLKEGVEYLCRRCKERLVLMKDN
ncbi:SprT family zinc-dependent metalloprotease [Rodentibacter trehalosifermentans]|uniref:Protein SprT n=1 Tax=Rodentibacter trehalosifermentans TaxID=1908263 RepID=A0A1V3IYI8_9PAST|nr:SprT family zinc-dependent metalloprotease [Rodentibacter trehalosifermentans]OOF44172.1 SprT family protein [Rodentibacter trehalosifermentans]OOF47264.1 SprT family protein [Rodentibacter trehalosifermentans]OOF48287.1 SprT family protein [Rodentibacter trehalosifermentans]